MRERSDINDLFRTRLEHVEMEVRDGFWEALERDLKEVGTPAWGVKKQSHKSSLFYLKRWAVAASVLVLLGAVSWLMWTAHPDKAGQEPLDSSWAMADGSVPMVQDVNPLMADGSSHSSESQNISNNESAMPTGYAKVSNSRAATEQPMSVHVSITIRQKQYGARQQNSTMPPYYAIGQRSSYMRRARGTEDRDKAQESPSQTASVEDCSALLNTRNWALKASLGTSVPMGAYGVPFTADVSVERRLTQRLSVEAGVQYNRLVESAAKSLHTLGIPVKLNFLLAQRERVDFYAQVGGMVEKCVAGAADNSFRAEPVQGSVLAGVGVRYKLTDRLALFAEPSVSHHFDTDSSSRTLRTERPVNVNLLCGLRMTY